MSLKSFALSLEIQTANNGLQRFEDVIAPHQIEWLDAVAPSFEALAKNKKPPIGRFWIEATKGCSKDSDVGCYVLWVLAFSSRPLTIQIAAADQDQAGETWRAMNAAIRQHPWLSGLVTCNNWRLTNPKTGSVCDVVAADVAGSQGARPDLLVINELSCIVKQEFAENLMDNATKMPNGIVIVATNAGSVDSWQWRWRETARCSPRWSFHQYDKPAPWLDPADLEEAKKRNSKSRFNRLFWGVWSTGSDFIDGDLIEAAIMQPTRAGLPMPGFLTFADPQFSYVSALDLGVKNDYCALVTLGIHGAGQFMRLATEQSWAPDGKTGETDLVAVEAAVLEMWHKFRPVGVFFDPHQCALMSQRLRARGVRMIEYPFSETTHVAMAEAMLQVFTAKKIKLPRCSVTIEQIRRLSVQEKSYGQRLVFPRNRAGHCDVAVALAIAIANGRETMGRPTGQTLVIDGGFMQGKFNQFHPLYPQQF